MHETRKTYKKVGNPMQNVWKLAGNTGYGNLGEESSYNQGYH